MRTRPEAATDRGAWSRLSKLARAKNRQSVSRMPAPLARCTLEPINLSGLGSGDIDDNSIPATPETTHREASPRALETKRPRNSGTLWFSDSAIRRAD
jgi:hypothetical protein